MNFEEFKCDYLFTEEENRLHPLIFRFEIPPNQVRSVYSPRIEHAAKLPIQHLKPEPPNDGKFTIVGSGPTLEGFLDKLDGTICSVNKAHEYLISNNIIPNVHVIFENDIFKPEEALGGPPHHDVTYYVCSSCSEELFANLKDYKVVLWHSDFANADYHKFMDSHFSNDEIAVGEPNITLTKAIGIGKVLGYRKFELYGIDCSFPIPWYEGKNSDISKIGIDEKTIVCARNKANEYRRYISNGFYVYQVIQFMRNYKDLDVKIHGDGLLGFVYD